MIVDNWQSRGVVRNRFEKKIRKLKIENQNKIIATLNRSMRDVRTEIKQDQRIFLIGMRVRARGWDWSG